MMLLKLIEETIRHNKAYAFKKYNPVDNGISNIIMNGENQMLAEALHWGGA